MSSNRPPTRRALPIFELFEAWKRDSWASANRQQSGRQNPYVNVSRLKTILLRTRKSKSFNDGRAHIWIFRSLKNDSGKSANQPHCWTAQPIFQLFEPWKSYSWPSANRPFCRTVLLLSERSAAWICHSLKLANRPPCISARYISECFAALKQNSWVSNISRSVTYQGSTTHTSTFRRLRTRFIRISKSKSFHDGTAHISTFRKLNKRFLSISKLNTGGKALPIFE